MLAGKGLKLIWGVLNILYFSEERNEKRKRIKVTLHGVSKRDREN